MQNAVVNIKVDPKVKKKAQEVAEELGFSLSAVLTGFMKKFIREKRISFSLEPEYTDHFNKAMEESERDVKAGRVISFKDWEEEKKYLLKMIDNDKAKSS